MAKKVVVTGGAGYLGKAIVERLVRDGCEVVSYDPIEHKLEGAETVIGSVLDEGNLYAAFKGADTVYHLAGILGTSELIYTSASAVKVNILGMVNVLDASLAANVETVFTPTKHFDWLDSYTITKRTAAEFMQLYHEYFDIKVKIIRWLNVYGPGQKTHPVRKCIPLLVLQALHNKPMEVYGDGEQFIDLEWIDDVVDITVKYVDQSESDPTIRDLGCVQRLTINKMAETIKRLAGSKSVIEHIDMRVGEGEPGLVQALPTVNCIDIIDWNSMPEDLDTGFTKTINYYKKMNILTQEAALSYHDARSWS